MFEQTGLLQPFVSSPNSEELEFSADKVKQASKAGPGSEAAQKKRLWVALHSAALEPSKAESMLVDPQLHRDVTSFLAACLEQLIANVERGDFSVEKDETIAALRLLSLLAPGFYEKEQYLDLLRSWANASLTDLTYSWRCYPVCFNLREGQTSCVVCFGA